LAMAEDALIEAHVRTQYANKQGPVAIYKCDDCGLFHLTSQGQLNERLKKMIDDGTIKRLQDAANWERKLHKRR